MVIPDVYPGNDVWQEKLTLAGEDLLPVFMQHIYDTLTCL